MTSTAHRAALMSAPQLELAELLDRTLGAGVVVGGDVTLSLAGVELVYLNLRALLASVATLEARGIPFGLPGSRPDPVGEAPGAATRVPRQPAGPRREAAADAVPLPPLPAPPRAGRGQGERGDRLDRGLANLVLAVVEVLRKLMESQALRRVEAGSLAPEQVERLGVALERLERQMELLKEHFGVDDDDLALRLGPLPGLEQDADRP